MKKIVLLFLVTLTVLQATAQVSKNYPAGFRKANLPERFKNLGVKVSNNANIDNQVPLASPVIPNTQISSTNATILETLVGCTYWDLQTDNSICNRLVVNSDGTIAAAWITSPNADLTTTPPYPDRGTGYNYFDGTTWIHPNCPSPREEVIRTGFTNVVNTDSGIEMLIAHQAVSLPGNFNRIAVSRRPVKGTGAWSITYPWGSVSHDAWPHACSAGENVYVIWQGSGPGAPISTVLGQSGPIFFANSTDAGATWNSKTVPHQIDSTFYLGFSSDSYSIDAKDSIVVIGFGDSNTDVGILKSTDFGQNWTKTIIQQHPIPFYVPGSITDTNNNGIADTIFVNGGDMNVLIDNNGMVHAWFSAMRIYSDSLFSQIVFPGSDGLEYWNESMGTNNYVEIASAQDFNGNGVLDFPVDTSIICTNSYPWGWYDGGLTMMPSAGIDASGKIYLTYATVDESADTSFNELRRHIYMITLAPPYNTLNWTYPYDIIPTIANGGNGEKQEGVYACTARLVDNNYAYVLYQRDAVPGNSMAANGTCDHALNTSLNVIVLAKIETAVVGIATSTQNNLFVSQNYPNPAVDFTYINIGLKKSADIRFDVYDIIGKKVYSEIRNHLKTGTHTISFNMSNLEPGIYNYTVIADGQRTTRQMIHQ